MQLDEHEWRHMRNSEITTRVANNDIHVTEASFAFSSAAWNHLRAYDERFKSSRFSSSIRYQQNLGRHWCQDQDQYQDRLGKTKTMTKTLRFCFDLLSKKTKTKTSKPKSRPRPRLNWIVQDMSLYELVHKRLVQFRQAPILLTIINIISFNYV